MRSNRFALVAGILALGAAACGDDVQVVEPAPPVPPPPPAVTASMAPASASVLIGNSVVFAVNASGGVAGDAASWTCASSNSGIASVSVVSAGCQATGVAAGSVTITATVTKSGETVNVGAQLTVTEEATGEPAFIIIKGVTGEPAAAGRPPTDASGLKGRVNVNLGVERGDQTLERLSVLVDGEVAVYQSFGSSMDDGMGTAPPEDDEAAEQAVYDFTLSFDSDAYVEHGDHADVDYTNGEHTLSAELQIASGMGSETITSNVMTVEFDNDDGFVVTADLGANSALADDGKRWYGGPDNGHIEISALAVSYSGAEMGTVTVSLPDCKAEEAEGDGHGNGADDPHASTEAAFEFDCEGQAGGRQLTVSAAGEPGMILNGDDLPVFNIDMESPENAPIIIANRNGRQEGWINAAVGIASKYNDKSGKDNWLVEGDGGAGVGGVGGYNMAVQVGEDLKKAKAAAAGSALPAESADNEAYCAIAVATDDLGNMTDLPDDDATCRAAPNGADVLLNHDQNATTDPDADGSATPNRWAYDSNADGNDDAITPTDVSLAGQTIEFGVDTTAPTIELGDDEYEMRVDNFGEDISGGIAFEPVDDSSNVGNSGLHSANGLMVKAERRVGTPTDKTECITVAADGSVATTDDAVDKDCDYTVAANTGTTVTPTARTGEQAYWTVSGKTQDKAGNSSTVASHTFAYDNVNAQATAPAVPGVVAAGKPFQGATYLNDGLSIRDYFGTMSYGSNVSLGVGAPQEVDKFNATALTNVNYAVTSPVGIVTGPASVHDPYAALQVAVAANAGASDGVLQPIDSVTIAVRDQAQASYTAAVTGIADAAVTGQVEDTKAFLLDEDGFNTDGYTFTGYNDDSDPADNYVVCGYAKCTGGDDAPKSTVKIGVRATAAAAGSFRDPFERVDFWMTDESGVAWLVGSDTSGTSGRVGGDGNDARFRTWSYSITVAGTALKAVTREGVRAPGSDADSDASKIIAIGVKANGVGFYKQTDNAVDFGTEDTDD